MGQIKLYTLNSHSDYKLENIMQKESKKFSFGEIDYKIMSARAKEYLIPLAVIYLPFVIAKITEDGFQLSDFKIDQVQQGALVLYILNRIFLAAQLFVQGKK